MMLLPPSRKKSHKNLVVIVGVVAITVAVIGMAAWEKAMKKTNGSVEEISKSGSNRQQITPVNSDSATDLANSNVEPEGSSVSVQNQDREVSIRSPTEPDDQSNSVLEKHVEELKAEKVRPEPDVHLNNNVIVVDDFDVVNSQETPVSHSEKPVVSAPKTTVDETEVEDLQEDQLAVNQTDNDTARSVLDQNWHEGFHEKEDEEVNLRNGDYGDDSETNVEMETLSLSSTGPVDVNSDELSTEPAIRTETDLALEMVSVAIPSDDQGDIPLGTDHPDSISSQTEPGSDWNPDQQLDGKSLTPESLFSWNWFFPKHEVKQ